MVNHSYRIDFLSHLNDNDIERFLASTGRAHDAVAVVSHRKAMLTGAFPRIVPPKAVLVQESLKMALGNPDASDLGVLGYLAPMRPSLIVPNDVAVLTCDELVQWWAPGDGPVGFATAQVVWFPLARNLILQFSEPDVDLRALGLPDLTSREGHEEMAVFVNELGAAAGERWIVHHPDDHPLAGKSPVPREIWGDELLEVHEEDGERREVYMHGRLIAEQ